MVSGKFSTSLNSCLVLDQHKEGRRETLHGPLSSCKPLGCSGPDLFHLSACCKQEDQDPVPFWSPFALKPGDGEREQTGWS